MDPEIIQGSRHSDARGWLDFFNLLDLTPAVRLYRIGPADTETIRAWQAHQHETKWFYCLRGAFVVNLIPLSKFKEDATSIIPEIYTLQADLQHILKIPGGYINGFRALEPGSELLVFSDKTLEESKKDDYRFNLDDIPFREEK